MRDSRSTFNSRFGFYMAAVGAAFGLGTLWRFPYITGANGGGAFVFLYVVFVAAIALPALICELILGRETGKNIVGALSWKPWTQGKKNWVWFGGLAVLASFIVLSYYTVVSGWVIHFVVQGVLGRFTDPNQAPEQIIDKLSSKGILQILLASIHLIITTSIVAKGVRDGIERTSRIFMPVLFVVLIFLVVHSLFLPGASEALRFLFYPDFSKLSANAIIEALGHALYTVSLGFGAMVAYGSYLKKEVHIPSEAVFVVTIDTVSTLCAGLLIFPVVFTAHVDADAGPALLFKTMPVLFNRLALGYWVALAFFTCLYFSALSASIAIFEGLVAYFVDQHGYSRPKATYLVAGVSFILGIASALSGSLFKNVRLGERGVLEILDQVIINWLLPIVALGIILFMARKVPEEVKEEQFLDKKSLVTVKLYPTWRSMVKWVLPIMISLMLVLQIVITLKTLRS